MKYLGLVNKTPSYQTLNKETQAKLDTSTAV
jgi:hypothetical protein